MKPGPKSKVNGRRPATPVAKPKIPSWLNREGRKIWRSLCPVLDAHDVLTALDATALALLCSAVEEYVKADAVLRAAEADAQPYCTKSARGTTTHPAARIKAKAWSNAVALLKEFGCTPAARASVDIPPPAPADDMLEMIRRHYNPESEDDDHEQQ
jgi:P27 family predicted phage terminase small subunit